MNEITNELRRQHSTLAPCPGPRGDKCLRCRAADEIDSLTSYVRVLGRLVVDLMDRADGESQRGDQPADKEGRDAFHPFWD